MNDMDELDGLAEDAIRRALRFEEDERPARFDAAAIVTAAEHRTVLQQVLRGVRGVALVGVSLAIEAIVAIAAFNVLANVDLGEPFGVVLSMIAGVAEQLVAFGALTASPSVGFAALAAVIFATLYERTTGRESMNV